jgi:hypothetical protein
MMLVSQFVTDGRFVPDPIQAVGGAPVPQPCNS